MHRIPNIMHSIYHSLSDIGLRFAEIYSPVSQVHVHMQSQILQNFGKMYFMQHCFICPPSDSSVSEDARTESLNLGLLRFWHCRSDALTHKVDWVPSFFFSRPKWDHPTPLTRRRVCVSPSFGSGGYTLAGGREDGGGVPIPTRGQTLWYSRYKCIFCLTFRYLIHNKIFLSKRFKPYRPSEHLFFYCLIYLPLYVLSQILISLTGA
jgi:hypothetical protein